MVIRKKQSIDFEPSVLNSIKRFREDYDLPFNSNSAVVNHVLTLFLGLSDETKIALTEACAKRIKEKSAQETMGFHSAHSQRQIYELDKLMEFFTRGKSRYTEIDYFINKDARKNIKRIDMVNGYVLIPEDWIVLPPVFPGIMCEPTDEIAKTAIIIEFLHGGPHFVFFTFEKGLCMTDGDRKVILDLCCEHSEDLKNSKELFVEKYVDSEGSVLNADDWYEANHAGFIQIGELGGTRAFEAPYGALLVRNDRKDADDLTDWKFL